MAVRCWMFVWIHVVPSDHLKSKLMPFGVTRDNDKHFKHLIRLLRMSCPIVQLQPNKHTMSQERRYNVAATSRRCSDVVCLLGTLKLMYIDSKWNDPWEQWKNPRSKRADMTRKRNAYLILHVYLDTFWMLPLCDLIFDNVLGQWRRAKIVTRLCRF